MYYQKEFNTLAKLGKLTNKIIKKINLCLKEDLNFENAEEFYFLPSLTDMKSILQDPEEYKNEQTKKDELFNQTLMLDTPIKKHLIKDATLFIQDTLNDKNLRITFMSSMTSKKNIEDIKDEIKNTKEDLQAAEKLKLTGIAQFLK